MQNHIANWKLEYTKMILTIVLAVAAWYIADRTFVKQKQFENQRLAYSKIRAVRNNFVSQIFLATKANLAYTVYDRLYMVTRDEKYYERYKYFQNLYNSLINNTEVEKSKLFEAVAIAETYFVLDNQLETAIDSLYAIKPLNINPIPDTIQSFTNLQKIGNDTEFNGLIVAVDTLYTKKIDTVLFLLKKQLKR